jgi:hypothetical protein
VRFYSATTGQSVAALLQSLSREGHGFSFEAADVSSGQIFVDPVAQ